ncbi:MAG: DNA mismatch repair endonuclease MutL [Chloroflexi bacterium]|nr:DNA mismatch repair endonuclease MutL [Chloroflexota bacterium]
MGKVKLLEKSVAERIAAGEVIERPVSVVKELVENSIDSGASRIQVEIKDGGLGMIRVTDDGCGMSREDVGLAVMRFATSKINELEDIDDLYTLGFRGEALPSIAAISRMEIVTRRKEDEEGTKLVMTGGEVMEESGVGCSAGTMIEVRELFYNTPARRKFLRGPSVEASRIIDWVQRMALYHTGIDFQVISNGRRSLSIPPQMDERDRLAGLFSIDPEELLPLEYNGEGISVKGFIARPQHARKDRARQVIFVRGRLIRHPAIMKALSAGAEPLIESGSYPLASIFIDVDSDLDVNVHPTKSEVRFSKGQDVFKAVQDAVQGAYRAYGVKEIRDVRADDGGYVGQEPALYQKISFDSFDQIPGNLEFMRDSQSLFPAVQPAGVEPAPTVWQLGGTYIVGIKDGDLWIIDQHAAAERLAYNRLRTYLDQNIVESQELLLPEIVEVAPEIMEFVSGRLEEFSRLGLVIEIFGDNTLLIRAVPSILDRFEPGRDFLPLLEDAMKEDSGITGIEEALLRSMACHGSIRAGELLDSREMNRLLSELLKTPDNSHCPHGRPTVVRFKQSDLEKMFKR